MTTHDKTLSQANAKAMSQAAETFALRFGIPVLSKGCVMGAVGVSAGTVEQDVAVAMAAMAALESGVADAGPTGHRPD